MSDNENYSDYKHRVIYGTNFDKSNFSTNPIGRLGGQGDWQDKQKFSYSIGATHPLMVYVREREVLISNVKNTNFLNFLKKED